MYKYLKYFDHIRYGVHCGKLYYKFYISIIGYIDEFGRSDYETFCEDPPKCYTWYYPEHVYIVYFNTSTDDWYDLVAELHRRQPDRSLRINDAGDVFLVTVESEFPRIFNGLLIKHGEFIVTHVHVFAGDAKLTSSVIKKDAFSLINITRYKEYGDVTPNLRDYKIYDMDVTGPNLKRLIRGRER